MKKLRCVIVDDEPVARKVIREFIGQVPFLSLCGQFEDVQKTDEFLRREHADLLFLDIEMPEYNGLDYLKTSSVSPMVILTTAFPNYALEGYELDIVDYLLKPIAFHRFLKAVQKAREYQELKHTALQTISSEFLFVRTDKRIEKIELAQLVFVESLGNYVAIHTTTKKTVAHLTLKSLESQLPTMGFVKIHQSYLIALNKVDAVEGNSIRIGERSLPVARNYRQKVMDQIEQRLLRR